MFELSIPAPNVKHQNWIPINTYRTMSSAIQRRGSWSGHTPSNVSAQSQVSKYSQSYEHITEDSSGPCTDDLYFPPIVTQQRPDSMIVSLDAMIDRLMSCPRFGMKSIVVNLNGKMVLEFGEHVSITEALRMAYGRRNTSIPVPTVHHVVERGDSTYTLMDKIDGEPLDSVVHILDGAQHGDLA